MKDELADLRQLDLPFDVDHVLPQCHECVRNQLKKYEKFVENDKTIGKQFLVPCRGIKKELVTLMEQSTKTDEQLQYLKAVRDKVEFAKVFARLPGNIPWIARWYQEQVLRCTSRRKVLRIGRRTGKTDSVCIEILYKLYTSKDRKIFVTGPQKVHVEEIFTRLRSFISANTSLKDSVVRDVAAPYYEIKMKNGSRVRGFAGGAKGKKEGLAGRGQDADDIYCEEMDYIDETALRGGIFPILHTSPNTSLVGFSTPTGFKTPYYSLCEENPRYKEFHFTYKVLPWWKQVESEKPQFTEENWKHEYLAEWGTAEAGVYKPSYIDRALIDYEYKDIIRNPSWKYTIGTDWNEKYGTEIIVLGFNPFTNKFQVVDGLHVEASEFTQLTGVSKLLEMNRKWRPHFVYIDAGNGCLSKDSLVYTDKGLKEIQYIKAGDNVLSHNGRFKTVVTAVNTGQKNSYSMKPAFCLKTIVSNKHKHIVYRSNDKFNDFFWTIPTDKISSSSLKFKELTTEELDKDKDFLIVPKQKILHKKSLVVDLVEELEGVPNLNYDENCIWNTSSYNTTPNLSTNDIIEKYNTSRATIQRTKRKIKNNEKFTRSEKILAKQLFKDYGDNWYVSEYKKIPRYINILDPDFLNLYGWYLSEGHAGVNNIEISQMPFHYEKEFNDLISYCSSIWDTNVIIRKNGMKRLFILSSLLTEFFKRIGGSHCYNKFIDQRIINNNGYQLLPSLFWGDGHEHSHGINISLTSYSLIMQIRQILVNNGILSGIHKIEPRKRSDGYQDSASQLMLYINSNKLNVDKINNILKTNLKARDGIFRRKYVELSDCFLVPIKKLYNINKQEDMYDLTVEEDSSFCVNGFATHNSTNYEILRKTAYDNMRRDGDRDTANLLNILKKYDAGASIEIRDPVTSQKKKSPAKPFMVNASVRLFEQNKIRISTHDHILEKQLRNYIIDKITPTKIPVYGLEDEKVKDHRLDALNLAIVAFQLEFDSLHTRHINTQVASVPDPRTLKQHNSPNKHGAQERHAIPQERRLDGGFQKTVVEEQLFAMTPARTDTGNGLNGIKTNRPGWSTDEEDLHVQKFLQRRRGRQQIRRDRPSRSNI